MIYRPVWNFVYDEKLSLKKIVAASERDHPDIANRRVQRRKYQDRIEAERPVFIDESCTATVVMDNTGSCKAIRQFIRFAGVKLFLLPKSAPDRNPIEQILV